MFIHSNSSFDLMAPRCRLRKARTAAACR